MGLFTSKAKLIRMMNEPMPLPLGRAEFEEWSDRIISGTLLKADLESQKFALANLLLHLGPTESHKPDAFFIHSLRKFAVNQVADAVRIEIRDTVKARLAQEESKKEPQKPSLMDAVPGEVVPTQPKTQVSDGKAILANGSV